MTNYSAIVTSNSHLALRRYTTLAIRVFFADRPIDPVFFRGKVGEFSQTERLVKRKRLNVFKFAGRTLWTEAKQIVLANVSLHMAHRAQHRP